jgi:RNA polymerase sigma factor (TIGR02999 family)
VARPRPLLRRLRPGHASRGKRGGGAIRVSLDATAVLAEERAAELVALDDALRALEEADPQKGRIVELRYFAGLSIEETAEALDISPTTVRREWGRAKAWLYRWIEGDANDA